MDFKDRKAIYLQIAEQLCDEILQRLYKEDERIPSVREYAAKMEVNANTTVRAYEWLQQHNIIYTKRGLGFFVVAGARDVIMKMRKEEFLSQQLPEFVQTMHTLGISVAQISEKMTKILDDIRDKYTNQNNIKI